ncbi:MAG: holo-ACP synthase [Clostridia bacterium]
MQIYCGTDIIEVDRIQDAIENTKGFKENVFTKNEINTFDKIKCISKYQRYAGRFAAKEAIYKAMSKVLIENKLNMSFIDVEIINLKELKNRPQVVFLNESLKRLSDEMKIDIDISISHIKEKAIAVAIVKSNKE